MYVDEESGGITDKGLLIEKVVGFVVVKETATDMVCMRFVSLNEEEHFWFFWKLRFTSLNSVFTNLSMVVMVSTKECFQFLLVSCCFVLIKIDGRN